MLTVRFTRSTFGKKGTEFEFTTDMLGMKEKAKELEQRVKSMSGKVDRNAISKLEKDEKQEASAKSMLDQVLKDKEKIEETIKELDRCKREALEKTWEKVNGCVYLTCRLLKKKFLIHATLTVTLVLYLLSCCLGTLRSCSHRKAKT